MSLAFDHVIMRPDPALLAAVGERLAEVLASNRRLSHSPALNFQARRRIEAVIAGLSTRSTGWTASPTGSKLPSRHTAATSRSIGSVTSAATAE